MVTQVLPIPPVLKRIIITACKRVGDARKIAQLNHSLVLYVRVPY